MPCPTPRNSAPAPIPSTRSSASPETPGTHAFRRQALRVVPPWHWPRAWPGWHMALTWAVRCAIRPASVAWSACGPRRAAWRPACSRRSTRRWALKARWRAMSRIWRCCSMPWWARSRRIRCRSPPTGPPTSRPRAQAGGRSAWRSPATLAFPRSTRAWLTSSWPPPASSRPKASSSRRPTPISARRANAPRRCAPCPMPT